MKSNVTLAAAQIDSTLFDVEGNLKKIVAWTRTAVAAGAELVVFPEAALTGYCFQSLTEAKHYAEPIPGPSVEIVEAICKELSVHVVFGMIEKDSHSVYNAAVLMGPQGLIATYRKIHLPHLGLDRFVARGLGPLAVHKTSVGTIGMHICYDATFPETARSMALDGAEILVLPTNWPEGREKMPQHVVHTRALENRVYFIACDRVGEERGFRFIGRSKIVSPTGDALVEASPDSEELIYTTINLDLARNKHVVFRPGAFEVDLFKDRRPELYGSLRRRVPPVKPST